MKRRTLWLLAALGGGVGALWYVMARRNAAAAAAAASTSFINPGNSNVAYADYGASVVPMNPITIGFPDQGTSPVPAAIRPSVPMPQSVAPVTPASFGVALANPSFVTPLPSVA